MVPTTAFYAASIAVLFIVLTIEVTKARRKNKVSIGDGGGDAPDLARKVRAQGNLAETAPLGLILLALTELNGAGVLLLHSIGATLLLGRLFHGYCFAFTQGHPKARTWGMGLTFLSLIIGVVALLVQSLTGFGL